MNDAGTNPVPEVVDRVGYLDVLDRLRRRKKAHTRPCDVIAADRRRLRATEVGANHRLAGATLIIIDKQPTVACRRDIV